MNLPADRHRAPTNGGKPTPIRRAPFFSLSLLAVDPGVSRAPKVETGAV